MTAKEYAKMGYPNFPSWQAIAEKAYEDGRLTGDLGKEIEQLRKRVAELEKDNKELNDILHDPERLGEWMAGG